MVSNALRINIDQVNIMLMLISCAVAYYIPFELVLLSYAFLGPAHYLTEISWLHDRDYFSGAKSILVPMLLLSALVTALMVLAKGSGLEAYLLFSAAIATAFAYLYAKSISQKIIMFMFVFALFFAFKFVYPPFVLGMAFLLPTIIHVYGFTGVFIALGARKAKSMWGMASLGVYLACGILFFVITPSQTTLFPQFLSKNIGFFNGLTDYVSTILSFDGRVNTHTLFAFLSFAYTYHYLNWFSKVDIIKWNTMPKKRMVYVAIAYFISIALYLYDYKVGFVALTLLSVAHVLLELPLNIVSLRMLGSMAFKKASPA